MRAKYALYCIDFEVDSYWPDNDVTLGQVGGVAVDDDENVIVFHRGDHPWDPRYQYVRSHFVSL